MKSKPFFSPEEIFGIKAFGVFLVILGIWGYVSARYFRSPSAEEKELYWSMIGRIMDDPGRDTAGKPAEALIAAQKGSREAAFNLAVCYLEGTGVIKDQAKAVSWLREAAGHGHIEAVRKLGECYEFGKGVEANAIEAYAYFSYSDIFTSNLNRVQTMSEKVYETLSLENRRLAASRAELVGRELFNQATAWLYADAVKGARSAQLELDLMYRLGPAHLRDYSKAYAFRVVIAESIFRDQGGSTSFYRDFWKETYTLYEKIPEGMARKKAVEQAKALWQEVKSSGEPLRVINSDK
jgi:hypothetical protein